MSIANYADLKTAVDNWTNHSLSSFVDDFIDVAESRHKRDIRAQGMLTRTTGNLSTTVATVSIPTGLLEVVRFRIEYSTHVFLEYRTPEEMTELRNAATGRPKYFTVADNIEFDRVPDDSSQYEVLYYKALTALSGSNTTNWITDNYPDLYLYACMWAASMFNRDDNATPYWNDLYNRAVLEVNAAEQRKIWGQGQLTTRAWSRSTP